MYKALSAELFYWDGSLNGAIAMMEWVGYPTPEDVSEAPMYIRLKTEKLDQLVPPHSWIVKLGEEYMPCTFELSPEVMLAKG